MVHVVLSYIWALKENTNMKHCYSYVLSSFCLLICLQWGKGLVDDQGRERRVLCDYCIRVVTI